MKITVLVPSEPYLKTAGVRIRYKRMQEPLARLGCTLETVPIDEFRELNLEDNGVLLFSKCQDARSLVLAAIANRAGVAVGVDLFDDYFSQEDDARFAGQRLWLHAMAKEASFFLCSTPRMLDIGARYFAPGAGHVLADPHEHFDPDRLAQDLAAKARKAERERRISILWFGMADNPNFPVGLHDLAAFGEALRPFNANSYKADLTILTNRKGIDGRVLERLRRLPVPFAIREWSKQREEEALSRCLVSFLPVNFQQFSTAKSLNRGVSALVGGTQLLSAGYPLYESLGDFVYADATALLRDLEQSRLKLSSEQVTQFADWIGAQADPNTEALKLVRFLQEKTHTAAPPLDGEGHWAVLHGGKSAASINAFAQRLSWLSLASPLTPGGMKCDAHLGFFGDDPALKLRVSQACLEHLPEELHVAAVPALGKGPLWEVPLTLPENSLLHHSRRTHRQGACAEAGRDAEVMKLTRLFFSNIFQDLTIIESELEPVRNAVRALERN